MHRGKSQKTRDFAPESETFSETPLSFSPLNRVYLTASEGLGENQERPYVEKCFII